MTVSRSILALLLCVALISTTTVYATVCTSPTCRLPNAAFTDVCYVNNGIITSCNDFSVPDPANCATTCKACPAGTARAQFEVDATRGYAIACLPIASEQAISAAHVGALATVMPTVPNVASPFGNSSRTTCGADQVSNQTHCVTCPNHHYVKFAAVSWQPTVANVANFPAFAYWLYYCQPCQAGTMKNPLFDAANTNSIQFAQGWIPSAPHPSTNVPCQSCAAGTFGTVDGAGCSNCPSLQTSINPSARLPKAFLPLTTPVTNCSACAAGRYYSTARATCVNCPVGTFSSSAGLTTCTACSANQICPPNTAIPIPASSMPASYATRNTLTRQTIAFPRTPMSSSIDALVRTLISVNPSNPDFQSLTAASVLNATSIPSAYRNSKPSYQDAAKNYIEDIKTYATRLQIMTVIIVFAALVVVLLGVVSTQAECCPSNIRDGVRVSLQKGDLLFDVNHYITLGQSPRRVPTPLGGIMLIVTFFLLVIIIVTSSIDYVHPSQVLPGASPNQPNFTPAGVSTWEVKFYGYQGGSCSNQVSASDPSAFSNDLTSTSSFDSTKLVCTVTISCSACLLNSNTKITVSPTGRAIGIGVRISTPGFTREDGSVHSTPYVVSNFLFADDLGRTFYDENVFTYNYVKTMITTPQNESLVTGLYKLADAKSGYQELIYDDLNAVSSIYANYAPSFTGGVVASLNIVNSPLNYELNFPLQTPIVLISSILALFGSSIGGFAAILGVLESFWWKKHGEVTGYNVDSNVGIWTRLVRPLPLSIIDPQFKETKEEVAAQWATVELSTKQ